MLRAYKSNSVSRVKKAIKKGDSLGTVKISGAIVYDGCWAEVVYKDVILAHMEIRSKYASATPFSSHYPTKSGKYSSHPGITLMAVEGTIKLDETKHIDEWTQIEFTELKGWHIFALSGGRYSYQIAFVKDKPLKPIKAKKTK